MPKFAIPKTITFENLGEEFKNSQLTFRTIPTNEYEWLASQQDVLKKAKDEDSVGILNDILGKYFIKGTFYDMDSGKDLEVNADDLKFFNVEVLNSCLTALVGVSSDLKDNEKLKTQ